MSKKLVFFASYATDYTGVCGHLPRGGETVIGTEFKMGPGGKGSNQAVAAHRLGGEVNLITKIGEDLSGDYARNFYLKEQISTKYVIVDPKEASGVALIFVDGGTKENQVLIVPGACTMFTDEDVERVRDAICNADIFMGQFEVNLDALEKAMDIAKSEGLQIVVNPAPAKKVSNEFLAKIDVITPNETEAELLTGIPVDSEESAHRVAEVFHKAGIESVIITMGEKGVFASKGGQERVIPAHIVKVVDTTGAGDAFNGALGFALAEGLDFFDAAEYANRAASFAVQRFGSGPSMPYKEEMEGE